MFLSHQCHSIYTTTALHETNTPPLPSLLYGRQVSPESSAFDELSLTRLNSVGGGGARLGKAGKDGDDMQTIYGGSAGMGGGGMGTETSSLLDSQSDYDFIVKCIVQCPTLFGEGVRYFDACRQITV